jgi:hypothetical protein
MSRVRLKALGRLRYQVSGFGCQHGRQERFPLVVPRGALPVIPRSRQRRGISSSFAPSPAVDSCAPASVLRPQPPPSHPNHPNHPAPQAPSKTIQIIQRRQAPSKSSKSSSAVRRHPSHPNHPAPSGAIQVIQIIQRRQAPSKVIHAEGIHFRLQATSCQGIPSYWLGCQDKFQLVREKPEKTSAIARRFRRGISTVLPQR